MAELDPPKPRTNPRTETPCNDPDLGPHPAPERSLAEDMGGTVDELRQMFTDFGLRPYRLFSIVARWSGGSRGRGSEVVEKVVELLPTPKVTTEPLNYDLRSGGTTESGVMRVTEISPRYTEDDINGLFHLQPLPSDRIGWIEMRIDRRDGEPVRRRFVVQGVPFRDAENFQWTCRLLSQDQPRDRAGRLRGAGAQ